MSSLLQALLALSIATGLMIMVLVIFSVITIYWGYCDIAVIFTVILLKAWPWLKIMPLINLIILPKNT